MSLTVGNIALENNVFLAPMSGVTDLPFRRLVRGFGAGLVFSEMIASRPSLDEFRRAPAAIKDFADEFPVAVQLAGCEPEIVAEAARIHEARGASIIDINFGCPVKKVVNNFAGSALMRDEDLAVRILEQTVKAVKVPVTVKMRLGWDEHSINAPSLARKAQDAGIQMVTVHGRTRNQLYNGTADWEAIASVREKISVPLIVNGDIGSASDARHAMAESGADGVMVGRACYGRPWLIREIIDGLAGQSARTISIGDLRDTVLRHYNDMLDYYGPAKTVGLARKHIGWYCDGLAGCDDLRSRINAMNDPKGVLSTLEDYFVMLEADVTGLPVSMPAPEAQSIERAFQEARES